VAVLAVGCGHNPIGVPQEARLHAQSDHPAWTSARPGTVYVHDATSGGIVYQGRLDMGQDISVDPAGNQITVDGQPVQTNRLTKGHQYQIFFEQLPVGR
jgi:hypothetical protein